jgi:hypothetical protein
MRLSTRYYENNMSKTLHELAKEMLNKANVEVLTETGKLKKELEEAKSPADIVKDIDSAIAADKKGIIDKKSRKLLGKIKTHYSSVTEDDEDKLKQNEPPFEPDKKPSSNWTSAKNKAKNLARAAMKKQVKKKVNEDKIKPDSKIKVAGKYLFGNTKGNVAHIEGDKTKKITKEGDDWEKLAKKKGLPLNQTPGFKEGPVEKTIRKIGTKLKKLTEADLDELSVEKLHQYRKKSMSTFVPNWNPKNKRVKGVYKAEKQIEKKTGVKQFDVGAS